MVCRTYDPREIVVASELHRDIAVVPAIDIRLDGRRCANRRGGFVDLDRDHVAGRTCVARQIADGLRGTRHRRAFVVTTWRVFM